MKFNTNPISLNEMLPYLDAKDHRDRPIPFSIIAITCNFHKGTGGEVLELIDVVQAKNVRLNPKTHQKITLPSGFYGSLPTALTDRVRRFYIPTSQVIRNANIRFITHIKINGDTMYRRVNY